jgi:predicted oxidoreductase
MNEHGKISVVDGMKASGMPYVRLGNTGLQVSRICLGMMTYGSNKWREWVLEEDDARPFVKRALELGINFFDTADMVNSVMIVACFEFSIEHLVFVRCERRDHRTCSE